MNPKSGMERKIPPSHCATIPFPPVNLSADLGHTKGGEGEALEMTHIIISLNAMPQEVAKTINSADILKGLGKFKEDSS